MYIVAHRFIQGAYRADHLHFFGDDIEAVAAVDAADGDDRRLLGDIHLAANDGLQAQHDLRCGDDGIDTAPGLRAVGLAAFDFDAQNIRRGHQRPSAIADDAGMQLGNDVQTENRVRPGILQRALLHHQRRAAFFAARRAFLRRLENELDRSGELLLDLGEHFRHAH